LTYYTTRIIGQVRQQLAATEETNFVTHQILSDNQDMENNVKEITVLLKLCVHQTNIRARPHKGHNQKSRRNIWW
jgi:hypothetical protein